MYFFKHEDLVLNSSFPFFIQFEVDWNVVVMVVTTSQKINQGMKMYLKRLGFFSTFTRRFVAPRNGAQSEQKKCKGSE